MTTKGEVPPGRPAIPADLARRPRTLVVVPGSGRARLAAMARLSLRIDFDGADSIGRGQIRLLELLDETGPIAAAGRAMNISYRRASRLIDALNTPFPPPVVAAQPRHSSRRRGGKRG